MLLSILRLAEAVGTMRRKKTSLRNGSYFEDQKKGFPLQGFSFWYIVVLIPTYEENTILFCSHRNDSRSWKRIFPRCLHHVRAKLIHLNPSIKILSRSPLSVLFLRITTLSLIDQIRSYLNGWVCNREWCSMCFSTWTREKNLTCSLGMVKNCVAFVHRTKDDLREVRTRLTYIRRRFNRQMDQCWLPILVYSRSRKWCFPFFFFSSVSSSLSLSPLLARSLFVSLARTL